MLTLSIGRNPDNKIVIHDPTNSVSGNHGEIKIHPNGSIYYRDKSTNGTLVNGRRIHNEELTVQRGTPIIFPNNSRLDWNQVPFPSHLRNVKKEITIGKSEDNLIRLEAANSSRHHAVLKITKNGKYFLFDKSMNGTLVNGTKIPRYQDYPLKRSDKVLFAGADQLDWSKVPRPALRPVYYLIPLLLLLVVGSSFWIYSSGSKSVSSKYGKAVCLIYNCYYLAYLDGNDTLFYIGANGSVDVKSQRHHLSALQPFENFGSGFFVDEAGKIVTNKHVVSPWETEIADIQKIQEQIGIMDVNRNRTIRFNPRIVGVRARTGIFLNDSELDKTNPLKTFLDCKVVAIAPHENVDLAIIQTNLKTVPYQAGFVKSSDIITDQNQVNVDDEIAIIGFPLGFHFALDEIDNKVKSSTTHGRVSRISNKYKIQYDASTAGGASGSPVFNKSGKLIAVHFAGVTKEQGYNFGIPATHLRNLLNQ